MQKNRPKPPVIKCVSSADFLASLPVLMGYKAKNSIVIAFFEGNRASSAMRIDLPDAHTPYSETGLAKHVIALVRRIKKVTAVAIVIYTNETFKESGGAPRLKLGSWLEREMEKAGISVIELSCVASDAWSNLRDAESVFTGRPLSDLEDTLVSLEARTYLSEPLKEISDLGKIPQGDLALSRPIAKEIFVTAKLDPTFSSPRQVALYIDQVQQVLEEGVTANNIAVCIEVTKQLQTPMGWFAAITVMSLGVTDSAEKIDKFFGSDHHDKVNLLTDDCIFSQNVRLFSAYRIEPRKLRSYLAHLTKLCANVPFKNQPAIAALIAWGWWMGGMSTPAVQILQSAFEVENDHEIAQIVQQLVDSGPPLWIFDENVKNVG